MGRPGQIVALPGFLALRLHHAAGIQRRTASTLSGCRRSAARAYAKRSMPSAFAAPREPPAAPGRHEAGRLRAQPRRARLRRGALPALLGHSHQRRPGDQHPHARKADPPPEGLRVRRSCASLGDEIAHACAAPPIASGTRDAPKSPSPPRWPSRRPRPASPRSPRDDLRAVGRAEPAARALEPRRRRVDLLRPTDAAADIAATLLYPVTDRPFRELYELACQLERARSAPK